MKRLILLALACAIAPAALAQLYKYVDKDGKTVYSDQPPANLDSKQLNVQSGTSAATQAPKSALERDKELQKGRDEVKEKAKKSEAAMKRAQYEEERCQRAKDAYQRFTDGGRVTKYVNGERVFLEDDEIAAGKERAKREADEACKKG